MSLSVFALVACASMHASWAGDAGSGARQQTVSHSQVTLCALSPVALAPVEYAESEDMDGVFSAASAKAARGQTGANGPHCCSSSLAVAMWCPTAEPPYTGFRIHLRI
jgi:hypothetical protein